MNSLLYLYPNLLYEEAHITSFHFILYAKRFVSVKKTKNITLLHSRVFGHPLDTNQIQPEGFGFSFKTTFIHCMQFVCIIVN